MPRLSGWPDKPGHDQVGSATSFAPVTDRRPRHPGDRPPTRREDGCCHLLTELYLDGTAIPDDPILLCITRPFRSGARDPLPSPEIMG